MTDYWKSYAKKFCEICKCWYADNKISIERHEMGDRHKAMVQQRLRESAKKAKDKELADHDLRMTVLAMEQAAMASMSGSSAKKAVLTAAEESTITTDNKFAQEPTKEIANSIEELKEQRRKLKELKRKSKQSQLWIDDELREEDGTNVSDKTSETIVWVQAETSGGLLYYWHIFSGETRWDQPKCFYKSEEYMNCYNDIAAKITAQNQFIVATNDAQTEQSTSAQTNDGKIQIGVIAPQIAPEMSKERMKQATVGVGIKREYKEEHQYELSKEERRRIKRERKAVAVTQIPEGLIELTKHPEQREMESMGTTGMTYLQSKREQPELIASCVTTDNNTTNNPLGPWIPIKKEVQQPNIELKTEHRKEKHSKKYDDLPEQEFGPGTTMLAQAPAELLEIAEMDPEDLAFKHKEATTIDAKKKSSKVVGFRRPTMGNSANKSFRNRSRAS